MAGGETGDMRVLVVEDEQFLAEAVREGLGLAAISADIAPDGVAALQAVALVRYDVVLLDRDLPGVHGDEVCRRLVAGDDPPGILMLTAASRLQEKVGGFELGADDYLPKPFELPELVARVRALSRRRAPSGGSVLEAGEVRMHVLRHEVSRAGHAVRLTPKEFAVLEVLMREAGRPVSAEELLERAWDERANPFTNAVKVVISTLRQKLGEPWPIRTVPGVGYVVDDDRPSSGAGARRG